METETTRLIEASCPDCRGPLSQIQSNGGPLEYRCLVGHRYSMMSVLEGHSDAEETALWAAVVALEEAIRLVESMADSLDSQIAARLKRQAEEHRQLGARVREIIKRLEPLRPE